MIISHKHKFVFVHVTKVAGCSIADALLSVYAKDSGKHWPDMDPKEVERFSENSIYKNATCLPQHATAGMAKNHFKKVGLDWDSYFKFAFMRNPWERMVSQYHYGRRLISQQNRDFEWLRYYHCDFEGFVEKMASLSGLPDYQWHYLSDYEGVLVDHIGRYETLQMDFDDICEKIGLPQLQLPWVNKSEHKTYHEHYTPRTRDLIENKFYADIALGGYTYDS